MQQFKQGKYQNGKVQVAPSTENGEWESSEKLSYKIDKTIRANQYHWTFMGTGWSISPGYQLAKVKQFDQEINGWTKSRRTCNLKENTCKRLKKRKWFWIG